MRAITVCVDFDDLLAITLPRNVVHFDEVLVVTSPADTRTQELVRNIPKCRLYVTNEFYDHGAKFNKGLAMESGFDALGREGWICVIDADTLLPQKINWPELQVGKLYNPRRRILHEPKQWNEDLRWDNLPLSNDVVFAGYFQLFHATDPAISIKPWYDVTFAHAGGGDGYFQSRWQQHNKVRLPFEVLHLGPRDTNWFGRATRRIDNQEQDQKQQRDNNNIMENYLRFKGWHRPVTVDRFEEQVDVPGHQPSGFKLKGRRDR